MFNIFPQMKGVFQSKCFLKYEKPRKNVLVNIHTAVRLHKTSYVTQACSWSLTEMSILYVVGIPIQLKLGSYQ